MFTLSGGRGMITLFGEGDIVTLSGVGVWSPCLGWVYGHPVWGGCMVTLSGVAVWSPCLGWLYGHPVWGGSWISCVGTREQTPVKTLPSFVLRTWSPKKRKKVYRAGREQTDRQTDRHESVEQIFPSNFISEFFL